MNERVRTLLAVLAVVGLVSYPVVAATAAPESRVLLDSGREKIADVSVDGQNYSVYRYDNALPYASGVEMYAGGERVTTESEAESVAEVLAWQRAAREIGTGDVQTLQDILQTSQQIETVVTPPLEALNAALGVVDKLKSTSVPLAGSGWDVATKAVPALEAFEPAARDLRNQLQDWKQASQQVNENVPKVIDSLERIDAGEDVDYGSVSSQFAASMQALEDLESQSREVNSQLSDVASTTGDIAAGASSIPQVGGIVAGPFNSLQDALRTASSEVGRFADSLENQRSSLSSVRSTAESEQSALVGDWRTRQSADTKVKGTIGGGAGLLLLGGALVYRRRRGGADAGADSWVPSRSSGQAGADDGSDATTQSGGPDDGGSAGGQATGGPAGGEPTGAGGGNAMRRAADSSGVDAPDDPPTGGRDHAPSAGDDGGNAMQRAAGTDAGGSGGDLFDDDPGGSANAGGTADADGATDAGGSADTGGGLFDDDPAGSGSADDRGAGTPADGAAGGRDRTGPAAGETADREPEADDGSGPDYGDAPDYSDTPDHGVEESAGGAGGAGGAATGGPDPDPADAADLRRQARRDPDRKTAASLVALLESGERSAQEDAVEGLRHAVESHPGTVESAAPTLVDTLETGPEDLHEAAAETLGLLAESHPEAADPAIPSLLGLLDDDRGDVRAAAAEALGRLDAYRALNHLEELADEDPDMGVRVAADTAVRRIDG